MLIVLCMHGLLQVVQDGMGYYKDGIEFVREARSAGRRERTGVLFIATCPVLYLELERV